MARGRAALGEALCLRRGEHDPQHRQSRASSLQICVVPAPGRCSGPFLRHRRSQLRRRDRDAAWRCVRHSSRLLQLAAPQQIGAGGRKAGQGDAAVTPIAIGIAGFGEIARREHVAAIAATDGLCLTAVADPAGRHATVPVSASLEEMLAAHPEIQAVALCMPPSDRASAARDAILAGRHVLLEKPPCATLAEAEALRELASAEGVSLMTAWHSQEGAAVAAARDWLHGKTVRSVRVVWKEDVRVWHPGQAWIWTKGGFGVFDPGINALSILTTILPGTLDVREAALRVPANCATPIAASLSLEGEQGFSVSVELDFLQTGPQSWDIHIETDQGQALLSDGGNSLTVDGRPFAFPPQAEYPALYARFAKLIRARKSDVDLEPLRLAEQALAKGRILLVEPFEE
ncbi:MAG: Gfo/Idh/MocA family oxidoreductase [Sphingobium sp.]|nr:Gfo/Idh/MocA family oxidoreductase [Sphingobium sp.]